MDYSSLIPTINTLRNVIDITLVFIIVYVVLRLLRGTRAVPTVIADPPLPTIAKLAALAVLNFFWPLLVLGAAVTVWFVWLACQAGGWGYAAVAFAGGVGLTVAVTTRSSASCGSAGLCCVPVMSGPRVVVPTPLSEPGVGPEK